MIVVGWGGFFVLLAVLHFALPYIEKLMDWNPRGIVGFIYGVIAGTATLIVGLAFVLTWTVLFPVGVIMSVFMMMGMEGRTSLIVAAVIVAGLYLRYKPWRKPT